MRSLFFHTAFAPLTICLLVHAARKLDVQDVIRDWLGKLDRSAKVRVAVGPADDRTN